MSSRGGERGAPPPNTVPLGPGLQRKNGGGTQHSVDDTCLGHVIAMGPPGTSWGFQTSGSPSIKQGQSQADGDTSLSTMCVCTARGARCHVPPLSPSSDSHPTPCSPQPHPRSSFLLPARPGSRDSSLLHGTHAGALMPRGSGRGWCSLQQGRGRLAHLLQWGRGLGSYRGMCACGLSWPPALLSTLSFLFGPAS